MLPHLPSSACSCLHQHCESVAFKQQGLLAPDMAVAALLPCCLAALLCSRVPLPSRQDVHAGLTHPRLLLRVSLRSLGLFFQDGCRTEASPLSGVCHNTAQHGTARHSTAAQYTKGEIKYTASQQLSTADFHTDGMLRHSSTLT